MDPHILFHAISDQAKARVWEFIRQQGLTIDDLGIALAEVVLLRSAND